MRSHSVLFPHCSWRSCQSTDFQKFRTLIDLFTYLPQAGFRRGDEKGKVKGKEKAREKREGKRAGIVRNGEEKGNGED